jgi:DNA-binding transcriptional MerR regulator
MPDIAANVEIPNRALFKPAEVCEIVKVQPYVLRSWEAEFPELGVAKAAGGPRVYRRRDVEQVVKIKHLLLVDGLTLAGARRRLEEETAPVAVDEPAIDELIGRNARERLTSVKRGLRSILDLLASNGGVRAVASHEPVGSAVSRTRPLAGAGGKVARDRSAAAGRVLARSGRARRKR